MHFISNTDFYCIFFLYIDFAHFRGFTRCTIRPERVVRACFTGGGSGDTETEAAREAADFAFDVVAC